MWDFDHPEFKLSCGSIFAGVYIRTTAFLTAIWHENHHRLRRHSQWLQPFNNLLGRCVDSPFPTPLLKLESVSCRVSRAESERARSRAYIPAGDDMKSVEPASTRGAGGRRRTRESNGEASLRVVLDTISLWYYTHCPQILERSSARRSLIPKSIIHEHKFINACPYIAIHRIWICISCQFYSYMVRSRAVGNLDSDSVKSVININRRANRWHNNRWYKSFLKIRRSIDLSRQIVSCWRIRRVRRLHYFVFCFSCSSRALSVSSFLRLTQSCDEREINHGVQMHGEMKKKLCSKESHQGTHGGGFCLIA